MSVSRSRFGRGRLRVERERALLRARQRAREGFNVALPHAVALRDIGEFLEVVFAQAVDWSAALVFSGLAIAIELPGRVTEFVVEQRVTLRVADRRVLPEGALQQDHEVERRDLAIEIRGPFTLAERLAAVHVGPPGGAPREDDPRLPQLGVVRLDQRVEGLVNRRVIGRREKLVT